MSDQEVFVAVHRAMSRLKPGELTLGQIAAEAGLTAGALVQRFGSKRALLLAVAEHAAASTDSLMETFRRRYDSPLEALRAYAEEMAGLAESPAGFARNLAYLQIDLEDVDFRQHLVAQAHATRAALRGLVAAAIAKGELKRTTDAVKLTRSVEAVLAGSMMTWAFYRQGTAARWMRDDLEAVLAPHGQIRRGNTSKSGAVHRSGTDTPRRR